jgi:hypothetical protein
MFWVVRGIERIKDKIVGRNNLHTIPANVISEDKAVFKAIPHIHHEIALTSVDARLTSNQNGVLGVKMLSKLD